MAGLQIFGTSGSKRVLARLPTVFQTHSKRRPVTRRRIASKDTPDFNAVACLYL
jgi:hypothetical protein